MLSRFFGPGTGLSTQNDPFGTFQREMNRVFDEVFRGFPAMRGGAALMGGFAPSLDAHETERGLEITAELPGMGEGDIELKLEGDLLTIAGEKRQARKEEEGGGTHLAERSYGRFQRAFRLPYAPDPGQVEARFEHGILHIAVPRPSQQAQSNRIQIRGGGGQPQGSAPGGTAAGGSTSAQGSAQAGGVPSSAGAGGSTGPDQGDQVDNSAQDNRPGQPARSA